MVTMMDFNSSNRIKDIMPEGTWSVRHSKKNTAAKLEPLSHTINYDVIDKYNNTTINSPSNNKSGSQNRGRNMIIGKTDTFFSRPLT